MLASANDADQMTLVCNFPASRPQQPNVAPHLLNLFETQHKGRGPGQRRQDVLLVRHMLAHTPRTVDQIMGDLMGKCAGIRVLLDSVTAPV